MTQVVSEQQSKQQEIHMVIVSNDPTRVYPAVTLALGASALGTKVHLYCTMSGWDVIKKDAGEKIKFPGMPPLDQYVKDAIGAGATVCACAPSTQMLAQLGINESTVIPGVKIEDVVGFLNNALPAAKDGGIVLFV
ncbi:MAG: DsrE/DsrF/DrsH-like family protein [Nitrososphaerota archaeon]|nr:DsrE/DsrF/DrsH-like family protein [Nitrososphaerota archaeon]MDG6995111.1 DsrE/DsrF/DrsH-like family protein [Nitrososphaerota archaeon]